MRRRRRYGIFTALLSAGLVGLLPLTGSTTDDGAEDGWTSPLAEEVSALDASTSGRLGVYVRRVSDGTAVSHRADRPWYLSSTTKVPVAIALLQQVEEGKLRLDKELTLRESDYVDGAGSLLWAEPGTTYTLQSLLDRMLRHSDSTATDMLIRLLGEDELNRRVARMVPRGFGPMTTILQVRYDVYAELLPGTDALSNMDVVRIQGAGGREERLQALVEALGADPAELRAPDLESAFERYYERGINAGTLEAFGLLLQRLVEGDLLTPAHTKLLLELMEDITTGDKRIQAGLPDNIGFAQKTGTQIGRACNVGILEPRGDAVVVAACVEKYDSQPEAEDTLRRLGTLLQNW